MKTSLTKMAIVMAAGIILTACAELRDPNRVVLPLDHGPRAQTTPWENQQRLLRAGPGARATGSTKNAPKPDTDN